MLLFHRCIFVKTPFCIHANAPLPAEEPSDYVQYLHPTTSNVCKVELFMNRVEQSTLLLLKETQRTVFIPFVSVKECTIARIHNTIPDFLLGNFTR